MPFDWPLVGEAVLRAWDFASSRGAPYNQDGFIRSLSDTLRAGIDLVPDLQALTPDQLNANVRLLLASLASVVHAYHRRDDVVINASYMVPVPPSDDLVATASFCRRDRRADSFACFLELKAWANDSDNLPARLSLPVEPLGSEHGQLFGAPEAYVENQMRIVSDTRDPHLAYPYAESESVREQIAAYFKEQSPRVRSFVSFPIEPPSTIQYTPLSGCSKKVLAVLNLHSNRKHIMGLFPGNQRKLQAVLVPLLHLLGHHLVRLHSVPAPNGANNSAATAS